MGNILVLFHSKSGNTAKMAAEVAAGAARIPGMEVRLRSVAEATAEDVRWCHGIAVGSPVNMGLVAWEMKQFWDTKMPDDWSKLDGRIGCAFSSQGGWGGGAEITCQSIHTILVNFGFLVFGPQLLIGVAAVGFVPKKAIGAADGIKGTFAYLIGDSFAKLGLGMIADGTPIFGLTGWAGTFAALDTAAIGCICLMAIVAIFEERKIRREKKIQQLKMA